MLQGMFGKRLAEHFSLLEPSSLVLDPKGNSQVALTRMRMPNGFPGPLHTFHQKRLFRYPCTCAVPTALRAGERGLTDAFIVSPNGMPAEFRYSIWSRSRSHCELQVSTRFTSIYHGPLSIDSATRTSKSAFATCIAPREPRMT